MIASQNYHYPFLMRMIQQLRDNTWPRVPYLLVFLLRLLFNFRGSISNDTDDYSSKWKREQNECCEQSALAMVALWMYGYKK